MGLMCSERPPHDTSGLFVCVMRNGRLVASWFAHHMASARQRITASVLRQPQTRSLFTSDFFFPLFLSPTVLARRLRREGKKLERTFGDDRASLLIIERLLRSCLQLIQKYEVPEALKRISILIIILT